VKKEERAIIRRTMFQRYPEALMTLKRLYRTLCSINVRYGNRMVPAIKSFKQNNLQPHLPVAQGSCALI
jgi:hypothetical protein